MRREKRQNRRWTKRTGPWSLALLLVFSGGLIGGGGENTNESKTDLPARVMWKADGQTMVKVPAGAFMMGGVKEANEKPRREVSLPDYYIDRTEITWRQYLTFCRETRRQPPPAFLLQNPFPEALLEHPVSGVTWADADDYCRHAGKRLPAESEWEKACAGPSGQTYPWGEGWNGSVCVNRTNSGDHTSPAGSMPGCQSPVGAMDLAGNVWEWTADWYKNYDGAPVTFDKTGQDRVVRGGAFFYSIDLLRCQNRNHLPPDDASPHGGFRCVADPDGSFSQKTALP